MRKIVYWQDVGSDGPPRSYPIGGLCYYLSPPRTPLQVTQDPVYAVVYTIFMIGSCAFYSRIWINLINISAVDVSHMIRKENLKINHNCKSWIVTFHRGDKIFCPKRGFIKFKSCNLRSKVEFYYPTQVYSYLLFSCMLRSQLLTIPLTFIMSYINFNW